MTRIFRTSCTALGAAGLLGLAGTADGATVYSNVNVTTAQTGTVNYPIATANGIGGIGDDYVTPFGSITLTGITYYGGTTPDTYHTSTNPGTEIPTEDLVNIFFFDSAGTKLFADQFFLSNTDSQSPGPHTIPITDDLFGNAKTTISGSGYILFNVTHQQPAVAADVTVTYAHDPTFLASFGAPPTTGTSLPGYITRSDVSGSPLVTNAGNPTAQFLQFQLDGVGVPEPTSLALAVPATLLLSRRKTASANTRKTS